MLDLVGSNLRRPEAMEFLTFAPIAWSRFFPEESSPSQWDLISREAGIVERRKHWEEKLASLVAQKKSRNPRKMWQETIDSVRERASRSLPSFAPSSSASFVHSFPDSFDEAFEISAGRSGRNGVAFGLAFHGVMERLDLSSGSNLQQLCRVKAREQSIPGKVEEIEGLCEKCLRHPLLERVRRSRRLFREGPFSVSLNENIVEGKMDLLFEKEGGWVVVDYKTDPVSGEALEQRF
jgi:ATP-dependent exoDNAse (exonuclease V) beta subunit